MNLKIEKKVLKGSHRPKNMKDIQFLSIDNTIFYYIL